MDFNYFRNMAGNPARIRHGRETQTASTRHERVAQLASTRGRGGVRTPIQTDEPGSSSRSRSQLARVSSSLQEEEEEKVVTYQEAEEEIPDADPPHGEEEEEEGYPGGPRDTSVLISYHEHVA